MCSKYQANLYHTFMGFNTLPPKQHITCKATHYLQNKQCPVLGWLYVQDTKSNLTLFLKYLVLKGLHSLGDKCGKKWKFGASARTM